MWPSGRPAGCARGGHFLIVTKLKLCVAFRTPTLQLILGYFLVSGILTVAAVQATRADLLQQKLSSNSSPGLNFTETVQHPYSAKHEVNAFNTFQSLGAVTSVLSMTRTIYIFLLKSDLIYGRVTQLRVCGVSSTVLWAADITTYAVISTMAGFPAILVAVASSPSHGGIEKLLSFLVSYVCLTAHNYALVLFITSITASVKTGVGIDSVLQMLQPIIHRTICTDALMTESTTRNFIHCFFALFPNEIMFFATSNSLRTDNGRGAFWLNERFKFVHQIFPMILLYASVLLLRSSRSLCNYGLGKSSVTSFIGKVKTEEPVFEAARLASKIRHYVSCGLSNVTFHATIEGSSRNLLQVVDLEFGVGELTAIVGDAPVTQAVRVLLLGMLRPDDGTIVLSDLPLHHWTRCQRADGMGLMGASSTLFARMTVLENLELFAQLKYQQGNKRRPGEAVQIVLVIFQERELDLNPILNRFFKDLEPYEKLLAKLAVMLLYEPQNLILDHPWRGLTNTMVEKITKFLRSLEASHCILVFCKHNEMQPHYWATHVVVCTEHYPPCHGLACGLPLKYGFGYHFTLRGLKMTVQERSNLFEAAQNFCSGVRILSETPSVIVFVTGSLIGSKQLEQITHAVNRLQEEGKIHHWQVSTSNISDVLENLRTKSDEMTNSDPGKCQAASETRIHHREHQRKQVILSFLKSRLQNSNSQISTIFLLSCVLSVLALETSNEQYEAQEISRGVISYFESGFNQAVASLLMRSSEKWLHQIVASIVVLLSTFQGFLCGNQLVQENRAGYRKFQEQSGCKRKYRYFSIASVDLSLGLFMSSVLTATMCAVLFESQMWHTCFWQWSVKILSINLITWCHNMLTGYFMASFVQKEADLFWALLVLNVFQLSAYNSSAFEHSVWLLFPVASYTAHLVSCMFPLYKMCCLKQANRLAPFARSYPPSVRKSLCFGVECDENSTNACSNSSLALFVICCQAAALIFSAALLKSMGAENSVLGQEEDHRERHRAPKSRKDIPNRPLKRGGILSPRFTGSSTGQPLEFQLDAGSIVVVSESSVESGLKAFLEALTRDSDELIFEHPSRAHCPFPWDISSMFDERLLNKNLTPYSTLMHMSVLRGVMDTRKHVLDILDLFELTSVAHVTAVDLTRADRSCLRSALGIVGFPFLSIIKDPLGDVSIFRSHRVLSKLEALVRTQKMCLILWCGEARIAEIFATDFLMMDRNEIKCHARVDDLLESFAATDVTIIREQGFGSNFIDVEEMFGGLYDQRPQLLIERLESVRFRFHESTAPSKLARLMEELVKLSEMAEIDAFHVETLPLGSILANHFTEEESRQYLESPGAAQDPIPTAGAGTAYYAEQPYRRMR